LSVGKLKSHPAVDDEFGTNDEGTIAGAQVENGLGDVVGFREASGPALDLLRVAKGLEITNEHRR